MRTVNVRLLAILLGGLLAAGVGVFVLNKVQVKRNAGIFLQEAGRAKERAADARKAKNRDVEKEEVRAVVQNYSKYFRLRPDDIEARQEYGDYLAELGDLPGAITAYDLVLRQSPDRSELRRKLVGLSMDLGVRSQMLLTDTSERASQTARWFRTANNHLQDFLLKELPKDAELWDWAGRCQAALEQDTQAAANPDESQEEAAIQSFKKAIELKPEQVDTYGRLAGFLRQRFGKTRVKEADGWIGKLLKANPEDVRAHLLAARYWQANGDLDKATAEAANALEIDEESRDALLLAAQCAQAKASRLFQKRQLDEGRKELDNARQFAQRGITLNTEDAEFYVVAAQVEAGAGDMNKAIDLLGQGLRATHDNPVLLWYTADWLIEVGRMDEAKAKVEQLAKSPYSEGRKGFMRGRIEFSESRWKDAIATLEKSRSGLALEPQLLKQLDLLVGRAYAQLGNADQATRAYQQSLSNDPFYAPAQAAMVDVLLSQGKLEAATEVYRQLLGRQIGVAPRAAARIVMMKNAQGKATERDWLELDALLGEAAKASPDSTEVPLIRFDSLLARGQQDEAEKMLIECRDKAPEKREYWNALILLAQQLQEWDKADGLIKDAQKKFGFTVELRLAVVRGAVMRQGKEGFARLLQAADKLDKFSEEEKISLLQGLLAIALQSDATEEAKFLARKVAEMQPANVQVRVTLFDLAMREGNPEGLEPLLGDIEKIEGRGPFWHYAKAAFLALSSKDSKDDPRLDESLKLLAQAAELRPSWSRVPMLSASILDQQQKPELAMSQYRKALELGDRSTGGIRRLVQLLFERRAFAEARAVLQLLPPSAGGEDIERLRTRIEAQAGDYDKSLAGARKSAEESNNASDHLWLGTLLDAGARRAAAEGQGMRAEELRDEAEKSLRKAVELNDKSPETWLPLIRFLSANDKRDKAEEAIEQFRGKVDPKEAPVILSQCYEAIGDTDKALEQFQQAMATHPDDINLILAAAEFLYYRANKPADGEKLVRRVIDGKIKATDDDLSRARRMMAVILASRGGFANSQEALKLVETNLARDASQPQDQRIRASILATLPSRAQRKQAAEAFDRLVGKGASATPEDRFILAQLYLSQGDAGWTKFTSTMRDLIALQGDDPRFLAFYIGALLQKGEVQNAENYMPRLERVAPNLFAAANLRADCLFRRGKFEEALQLLKGFIDKPGAEPVDRGVRMRLVAESIEQLAGRMKTGAAQAMRPTFVRDAETIFRQYIDLHPSEELLIVGFLTRLELINEAVDALERIVSSVNNPAAIAQAVVELLRSEAPNKPQRERTESLLKSALSRFERPTPLLIVMADMYAEQGRYTEAEAFYREVLRNEADNPVAMNNLAVLLALEKTELPEALRLINRAIEIAGPVAQMLDSRATVYIAMGDSVNAMKDIAQAIADLDGPVQYFHQAQAQLLAGRKTDAAASFETAKKKKLVRSSLQPLERPVFDQLDAIEE